MNTGKRISKVEKIDALNKAIRLVKIDRMSGLCHTARTLYVYNKHILYRQKRYLLSLIPKVTEANKYSPFYWKIYARAPRIRFLQEQIKLLEKSK